MLCGVWRRVGRTIWPLARLRAALACVYTREVEHSPLTVYMHMWGPPPPGVWATLRRFDPLEIPDRKQCPLAAEFRILVRQDADLYESEPDDISAFRIVLDHCLSSHEATCVLLAQAPAEFLHVECNDIQNDLAGYYCGIYRGEYFEEKEPAQLEAVRMIEREFHRRARWSPARAAWIEAVVNARRFS